MKKALSLCLAVIMLTTMFTGCTPKKVETAKSATSTTKVEEKKDLPVLKVAIMPFLLSLPVKYIADKGWDKEAGFKIETVLFTTGAPMNEALGANLWDVATIGTAAVNGIPIYDAKLIAETSDAAGGIELYARPDSAIAKVKGFNPTFPTLYGNPETVRGKTILLPVGTIAQLMSLKWLEKIGLKEKEVNTVHMEYAQAYQAFLSGQGDIIGLNPPLSFKAKSNGWVKVGSLNDLKIPQYDNLVASKSAYANKKDLLVKLVKLMYKANAEMKNDPALEAKLLGEWYKANGQDIPAQDVKDEVATRPLLTADDAKNKKLGDSIKTTAEFMASIGKLETDKLPIFDKNILDDILKEAIK